MPNTRHAIRRLPPRRPHAKRSGQRRRGGGMRALSDDGSAPPRARHARDLERGFGLVEVLADVGCTRGRRAAARQRVRTLPLVKRSDSTPPSQRRLHAQPHSMLRLVCWRLARWGWIKTPTTVLMSVSSFYFLYHFCKAVQHPRTIKNPCFLESVHLSAEREKEEKKKEKRRREVQGSNPRNWSQKKSGLGAQACQA